MFLRLTMTIAVLSIILGRISEDFWVQNRQFIIESKESIREGMIVMTVFLNNEALNDIVVGKNLGCGSTGFVFSAKNVQSQTENPISYGATKSSQNEEFAIKVYRETDANYIFCSGAYSVQKKLKKGKYGKYIVDMEEPIKFHSPGDEVIVTYEDEGERTVKVEPEFVCVLKMEKGTPLTKPIFKNISYKKQNTKKMVKFIIKLLRAYKILNFNMRYYHGDVKPENLLAVINPSTGEYEPRLIDLDFAFPWKESPDDKMPILYTRNYRPPELKKIVPLDDFDNDPIKEAEQKFQYTRYLFNIDLKEEAYALGKTILEILTTNYDFLKMESKILKEIKKIAYQMIENDSEIRISTAKAYELVRSLQRPTII